MNPQSSFVRRLREARSFVLATHVRIDGDGLGCVLALADVLSHLGKPNIVVLPDVVPRVYSFLPGAERVLLSTSTSTPPPLPPDLDTLVLLDAPEFKRLEPAFSRLPKNLFTMKLDHHPPASPRADVEVVDTHASSAAELLYRVLRDAHLHISPEAALNLYVGILTDTGRFTLANTTASALRTAAELVELGLHPGEIGTRLYRSYPLAVIALRADVAATLRLFDQGRIALALMTQDMLRHHVVHSVDTQDFADIPREIAGVEVGILLRELDDHSFKASLRSARIPILELARHFGGGGHPLASGFNIPGPADDAVNKIVHILQPIVAKGTP